MAGIRLIQIRDLCRDIRDLHVTVADIGDRLAIDAKKAAEITKAMLDVGYLDLPLENSEDKQTWYKLGRAGRTLSNAKFIKRINREQADAKIKACWSEFHRSTQITS